MDVNKLCFGCMKENENPGQRCSHCGFDIKEYMNTCSTRVLRPGTILNGQYLVGKVLGEGGFGITYLAFDLNLNLPTAIKEYFPVGLAVREVTEMRTNRISAFSRDKQYYFENGLKSFTEEARSLIRFRQEKGIVQVNTFFYENGTAYMVMEYIRGKSLKQYLRERNMPLSERETLEIMTPVLQVLEKIHEAGIIHRDISPDNIMLGENGKVCLIDFGAARMITGAETRSLEVVLKPGYTPFEQYHSHGKMGPWTDVYAVCATMYRMLSGKVPQEALFRLEKDHLESLYELAKKGECPPLSWSTSSAVEKGMAIRSEERYQKIRDLQEALTGSKQEKEKSVPPVNQKTVSQNTKDDTICEQKPETAKEFTELEKTEKLHSIVIVLCILAVAFVFLVVSAYLEGNKNHESTVDNTNAESTELYSKEQKQEMGTLEKISVQLQNAMDAEGVNYGVSGDGSVIMDSNVLFAYNTYSLTDEGKQYLDHFFPVFASVVLAEEFRGALEQIVFEGHTDMVGSYNFNLDLSKKRAQSVMEYCLSILAQEEKEEMSLLTEAVGRSFDEPVYTESGEVDADASRRVEIKILTKD